MPALQTPQMPLEAKAERSLHLLWPSVAVQVCELTVVCVEAVLVAAVHAVEVCELLCWRLLVVVLALLRALFQGMHVVVCVLLIHDEAPQRLVVLTSFLTWSAAWWCCCCCVVLLRLELLWSLLLTLVWY